MLASTAVMPVFGGLSDRLGRKGLFLAAVGVFCAGSLVAGVAPSMIPLVIGRALQGIGAGGITALSLVIFGDLFPGERRGRMQGLLTLVWGFASVAGPLLGGVIVDHWGWRWVFTMNLPLGALVIVLVWRGLRETAPATLRAGDHRLDVAGTALFLAGTSAALFACLERGPARAAAAVLGVLCLGAFLRVERTAPAPLLAPALFRERSLVAACAAGFFAGFAMFGALVHLPLLVQWGRGTDATTAGLSLMTMSLGWSGGGLVAGNVVNLLGFWRLCVLGMTAMAAGYAGLAARPDAGVAALSVAGAAVGTGMGLVSITLVLAVQTLIRREDRGIATSAVLFVRSIGGTLGVAVMGAVLTARVGLDASGLAAGAVHLPPALAAALIVEMGPVFWVGTAAAVFGLGATLFLPRSTAAKIGQPSRA
jgi:MFS family permease